MVEPPTIRSDVQWVRARCEAGACLEVLENYGGVIVRNSKMPETFVTFDHEEWTMFIDAIRRGELFHETGVADLHRTPTDPMQ